MVHLRTLLYFNVFQNVHILIKGTQIRLHSEIKGCVLHQYENYEKHVNC